MAKLIDIAGKTYGELTVLKFSENRICGTKKRAFWICLCTCGKECEVLGDNLKSGNTTRCQECGKIRNKARATKHGCAWINGKPGTTKEYMAWQAAKSRCNNPNNIRYALYGGRGIKMTECWENNFPQFLSDMGKCPEGFTLDRIDTNKNYEPGNCRWADYFTQNNNKSINIHVFEDGQKFTLSQYARHKGVRYSTLNGAINTRGEDPRIVAARVLSKKIKRDEATKIQV